MKDTKNVIAQNVSDALHLPDALHRDPTLESRSATHPKADAMHFYHHDLKQLPNLDKPEPKVF